MYEEYYGFAHPPFSLTPDPRFLYRSVSHDLALHRVAQAIRRKEGFIVLTGDIGTGKTTLCRTLIEQLDTTTFSALILNPSLSVEDLLRELLLGFGVASKDTVRTGRLASASKHELIRTLHDFLLSLVPLGATAVVIIDEAQHLSREVLEDIRLLSNLETSEQKLLQLMLVGQLNLLNLLRDSALRQLDQRISLRCKLDPLTREEVEVYITHRLSVARGTKPVTFTPDAIDLVHRLSAGVPRVINLLCDRALMAGAQSKAGTISDLLVLEASAVLDMHVPRAEETRTSDSEGWRPHIIDRITSIRIAPGVWRAAAALAAVSLIGAAAYAYYNRSTTRTPAVASDIPSPPAPPSRRLPSPPEVRMAPDPLPSLAPQPGSGWYAVLIGTYSTPNQVAATESALRAENLPVYAVDIATPEGIRRRLFVGRYRGRDQAVAAHQKLVSKFASARVVTIDEERLPGQ